MSNFAEDTQSLMSLYRMMILTRIFENYSEKLYKDGFIRGGLHLANGQEAVTTGVCSLLSSSDTLTCTYRGHGAVIAKGSKIDKLFGELLGRENGICKGKGGSMHLTDFSVGVLGSFAVVGAHLPISAGAAFTAKYRGTKDVNVTFFGDGSTNIGAFHETLNMSAVWKLPIVFVCENNLWGEYSPIEETTSTVNLVERGASYGIWSEQVDGNDVLAVREVAKAAISHARSGAGPAFIEAVTYRQKGHSARVDVGRPQEEVDAWMLRDPIIKFEKVLLLNGISQADLDNVRNEVDREVSEAVEIAKLWPEPSRAALFEDVVV